MFSSCPGSGLAIAYSFCFVGLGSGIGNTLQISDFGLRIEIKVAGCSFLVAGCWFLVAGSWLLVIKGQEREDHSISDCGMENQRIQDDHSLRSLRR
jgi:hypothetical protein